MIAQVKWGILGTSSISATMAEAISETAHAQCHAIGSRYAEKAQAFATQHNIPNAYSYDAVIADPEIHAVYIGLPNHLHKEWIIKCAQAGKHILCEKPLVLTPEELDEVCAVIAEANVFCMEALMYRHHPFTHKLKDIIQSGLLGNVKLYNATYNANIAEFANPTAGGSLRNLGCYPISLIRFLAHDEPEEVSAFGRRNVRNDNDSQVSLLMKFAGEKIAMIATADDIEKHWHFEVHGDKGYLKALSNPWMPEKKNNKALIYLHDGTSTEISIDAEHSLYVYQIDLLSSKILGMVDDEGISLQESLGNIVVIDACLKYMSL